MLAPTLTRAGSDLPACASKRCARRRILARETSHSIDWDMLDFYHLSRPQVLGRALSKPLTCKPKKCPVGYAETLNLTGVEYLDTASSFMIGRCRTCQARKSTEPEYGMTSGPEARGSHVKLFALVYPASGSAGEWLAVNSTPDASERRHQLHRVPSLHPIVATTHSPSGDLLVSFNGRSFGKCMTCSETD